MMEESQEITILSLGAGVQSSTLALMAMHGDIPKPTAAIFADTGWETIRVLSWLDWLEQQLDYPVYRVSNGNILNDLKAGLSNERYDGFFTKLPYFTKKGISKRQCTSDYKLAAIIQKTREIMGVGYKQRVVGKTVNMLIGISFDESHRAKPSRLKWIRNCFPLLEKRMYRLDCINWMKKHGYPVPPKSSCVGCPFHSDEFWAELKTDSRNEFDQAVEIDELLHNRTSNNWPEWTHKSLRPLSEIYFEKSTQADLFGNECDGICGT